MPVLESILAILAIPIVGVIIVSLIAFLLVSVLGAIFPSFGLILWGAILIAVGVLLAILKMPIIFYKKKGITISLSAITVISGTLMLLLSLFNISLFQFSSSVLSAPVMRLPTGSIFDSLKVTLAVYGVSALSVIDLASLFLVLITIFILVSAFVRKRKR